MLKETKRHCAVKDFIQLKESRLNKIRILKQQREREEFDEPIFWNNLRKKRNWSSTGLDKTTNFWIKVCTSLLTAFSLAVKTLVQNKLPFPHWLPGARTVMIPKCKDPRANNHKPIICLNTSYKLITAVINHNLRKIEASQNMLQLLR